MTKYLNAQRNPKNRISNSEVPLSLGLSGFVIPSCLGASSFELPVAFISPGGGELITIMLVLILLFGAKDAPKVFRSIQTFLDKMQRSAADFRYKMMYGDIHANTTDEEPYDVEADYPEEEEVDDQESEVRDQASEHGNPEPGTEKPEPNS